VVKQRVWGEQTIPSRIPSCPCNGLMLTSVSSSFLHAPQQKCNDNHTNKLQQPSSVSVVLKAVAVRRHLPSGSDKRANA